MNPERKALLVAALRSGEYTQGKNMLRHSAEDGYRYCCLGVACEEYRKATGDGRWVEEPRSSGRIADTPLFHFVTGVSRSWSALPIEVADWYGLDRMDPVVRDIDRTGELSISLGNLNDSEGSSFIDIADVIEKNF